MPDLCGTVTVFEPFQEEDVTIVNDSCSLGNNEILTGLPVNVGAEVNNDNVFGADVTIGIVANGNQITTEELEVGGFETKSFSFDVTFADPGDYEITVEIISATEIPTSGLSPAEMQEMHEAHSSQAAKSA